MPTPANDPARQPHDPLGDLVQPPSLSVRPTLESLIGEEAGNKGLHAALTESNVLIPDHPQLALVDLDQVLSQIQWHVVLCKARSIDPAIEIGESDELRGEPWLKVLTFESFIVAIDRLDRCCAVIPKSASLTPDEQQWLQTHLLSLIVDSDELAIALQDFSAAVNYIERNYEFVPPPPGEEMSEGELLWYKKTSLGTQSTPDFIVKGEISKPGGGGDRHLATLILRWGIDNVLAVWAS